MTSQFQARHRQHMQEINMEPEYLNGEEFLRSLEIKILDMEEKAASVRDERIEKLRKEIEEKTLKDSIAKANSLKNKPTNSGSVEGDHDEDERLLRIYSPDRRSLLADVARYRDYSEELEKIEESDLELLLDDEDKEFKNGRDYMVWLKNRLPCIEPFQPDDAIHYYFFRSWSKQDLKFCPGMVPITEENEDANFKDLREHEEDDDHPYIKLMTAPLILEGFKFKPDQVNVPVKASRDLPVITPDVERPTEGDIVVEKKTEKTSKREKKQKTSGRLGRLLRRLFGR